jgi:hypothetical protein
VLVITLVEVLTVQQCLWWLADSAAAHMTAPAEALTVQQRPWWQIPSAAVLEG